MAPRKATNSKSYSSYSVKSKKKAVKTRKKR